MPPGSSRRWALEDGSEIDDAFERKNAAPCNPQHLHLEGYPTVCASTTCWSGRSFIAFSSSG